MSWIWLAPARYDRQKEGQKVTSLASRLLNARKGINWWAALTAPGKRIPPRHPALLWPSCTAKAKCSSCLGSRTASPWAGSVYLCSCFPIWVWSSIKSELACALYYIRGKTLQKQNRRLPPQLALGKTQKVCRENLQGSFSSSHKTNFKNNEPWYRKSF